MADYPIISDVSMYIMRMLRERMCPEPIPSPSNIEVATPLSQEVDYILGIYLYDIREEGEVSVPSFISTGKTRLQRPPRPYSLYYMLFLNGSSQMGLKANDMQKVLGRAAQIVNDTNTVSPRSLQMWMESDEPAIILSPTKISLEEKVRVWSAINKPYQVSLFYKAAPVFLSSEIMVESPRVTDAVFNIGTG